MFSSQIMSYLSTASRERLASAARAERVLDDDFVSTFTPFSSAEAARSVNSSDETIAAMRAEIAEALDKLERSVVKVLEERQLAEKSASTWIAIGGGVVVFLIVVTAIAPLVTDNTIISSIFSSISVGGLLALLYSPVRQTMTIASDRSNLMLMVQSFRLRFTVANSVEQLQELARELTAALLVRNGEQAE